MFEIGELFSLILQAFLWLCITAFVGVVFFWKIFPKVSPKSSGPPNLSTTNNPSNVNVRLNSKIGKSASGVLCTNLNCVRCMKHEKLLQDPRDRFAKYLETNVNSNDNNPETSQLLNDRLMHAVSVASLRLDKKDTNMTKELARPAAELQNPTIFYFPKLSNHHVFNMKSSDYSQLNQEYVTNLNQLEMQWLELRDEFNDLWINFDDGAGWIENKVPTGNWFAFHIMDQGKLVPENVCRCPKTAKVLEKLEAGMMGCMFGFATFSVLMPGAHVTEHCGASNIRLRCHLGLHIPPSCTLVVNKEELTWTEGQCLLFDDSFLHEAKHGGSVPDQPRVIFMVDLWHTNLTKEERTDLRTIFASF